MKIQNIEIANFQGLRDVAVSFNAPVTLIAGPNGAGKTSLLEAIRLAILGQPERVSVKRDYTKMITEGAKVGAIQLGTDAGQFTYSLPDGKHVKAVPDIDDELIVALSGQNFATAPAEYRRAMLFRVTKSSASPAEVAARLKRRGAPQAKIEYITPMLRAGFAEACKLAKQQATEARGVWKGITGEVYGDKKAETWQIASRPEAFDVDALEQARAACHALAQDIASVQNAMGAARQKIQQHFENQNAIAELEEQASHLERARTKLSTDERELQAWDAKLSAIQLARPGNTESELTRRLAECTEEWCLMATNRPDIAEEYEQLLIRSRTHLSAYTAAQNEAGNDAKAVATIAAARDSYARAVANDHRDIANAESALRRLEQLKAASDDMPDMELLQARAHALNTEQNEANQDLQALTEQKRAFEWAQSAEEKALVAHKDVQEWTAIADALAPDGIQAEILAGALRPVNDCLYELAKVANWHRTQISNELDVLADSRPYALLSESEKWRADFLIQIALAQLSGTRLVVVDRFDVLDLDGRSDAVELFDVLAQKGHIQIIVAGTLKAKPKGLPDGIEALWIENKVLSNTEEVAA